MFEYLIRPADRDGVLDVRVGDADRVLTPDGWRRDLTRRGDHGATDGEAGIVFSMEDFGWHVVIDGVADDHEADAVVASVADRVASYSRQPVVWTRIT